MTEPSFIQLHRTFRDLRDEESGNPEGPYFQRAGFARSVSWDELLHTIDEQLSLNS